MNFDFLSSRENPNPFDLPSNSQESLIFRTISFGDMFTGRGEAIPKFHRFSWLFGRDSPFESKFSGVFWVPPVRPVGKTGQTGLLDFEQTRPFRPVQCTGQTGPGRSVLLIFQFAFDLLRGFARSFEAFCVVLAIPNSDQNA